MESMANARVRAVQNVDQILKNLKLKNLGQPLDEVLITTDPRLNHYKANEYRDILKNGLLFRKKFGETGNVKYYQILIPKQLVKEAFWSLHGEFGKHPGSTKTIMTYKEKYYFPKMAQLTRDWLMSCEQYIRESGIDRNLTPLQNRNDHIKAPEDDRKNDLLPELRPSVGFENFETALDVFWRCLYANLTFNQHAKLTAKVRINIMTKHAYLPTTLISDKSSDSVSHVNKERAGVLGSTLKHATRKIAQTIWLPEQPQASINQALEVETCDRMLFWLKYVSMAVLNYNNFCHTTSFLWSVSYNVLDFKLGNRPQQALISAKQKLPKMLLNKHRRSNKTFAELPCKPTSNTKLLTKKRPLLQNSKQQFMYMSHSWKQIIKGVKFFHGIPVELSLPKGVTN